MQGLPTTPLTPPPPGLTLAHPSTPWKVVRSMLGFVFLVLIIVQVSFVAIFGGILDSDFDGDLGPSNPLLTLFGTACLDSMHQLVFPLSAVQDSPMSSEGLNL